MPIKYLLYTGTTHILYLYIGTHDTQRHTWTCGFLSLSSSSSFDISLKIFYMCIYNEKTNKQLGIYLLHIGILFYLFYFQLFLPK